MRGLDQLERAPTAVGDVHAFDASPKTILVHVQDDETIDTRIESALSLARAYSAHLEFLHVTPMQAYATVDSFGGVFLMPHVLEAFEEQKKLLHTKLREKLGKEDVTWDYTEITGDIARQIISRASLADLVVIGREPTRTEFVGATIGLMGDLICRSRTPLFVVCGGRPTVDPLGPALICWDGSYEAADAVRSSIGMLKRAGGVHVVQVEERKAEAFPSTRLLEFLSRHGVHAELTIETVDKDAFDPAFVPDILVARAFAVDAAYLVMGGYNHSRMGEYVFGGVTRTMLSASPVPIVIAK